jgi:hypothetical protein
MENFLFNIPQLLTLTDFSTLNHVDMNFGDVFLVS